MDPKIIIVMPAYDAELTLEKTCRDIPRGIVSEIILCDDESKDKTVEIAKGLGLTVLRHEKNKGYGGNQKTLYAEALTRNPDIVVMLHPDYQYDSKKIPDLIQPILDERADIVLGSRILGRGAIKGGMPVYKYISNRFLTFCENKALGLNLSEYHTGLRAYSRGFLEKVRWQDNSDDFLFDGQILIKAARMGLRIAEIPIETRYFKEASQVGIFSGIKYGLGILWELVKWKR
ncbi:MAG: glycosyltransferase family 2 protein [Candidatus Omnitrophota bacterium]|nr:glycosyltransferase family 2 protein [Candidatus Omnitrophota bacterium]